MQNSSDKTEDNPAKMPVDNDDILFAEETEAEQPEASWKILIVDDEAEVHNITKLALGDVTFEHCSLSFLSAYSAKEAKHIIQAHPDIAVILLDVVMETEDAGLQLIHYVRQDLDNRTTRVILRTGQPGQAPEDIVVMNYGIDDYRTKTELTARKLFISVITALRAFSTITQILDVTQRLEKKLIPEAQIAQNPRQNTIQPLAQARRSFQSYSPVSNPHPVLENLSDLGVDLAFTSEDSDSLDTLQTMSMVSRIARMALRIVDGQSTQFGISHTKLAVLMYLSSEPNQCASPSTLAHYCGVSRAAMTGLLDGLTQKKYVERTDHPSDRRAVMINLTPDGYQFLERITPQHYQLSELMEALNETERRTLIELIIKFIRLLNESPDEPIGE